jgi:hypothetical protein
MAELKEIYNRDTEIEADHNSWTTIPAGFKLIIQTGSPDYFLLIEGDGDELLIG